MKVNITNIYCMLIFIAFVISIGFNVWHVGIMSDRIDDLEKELGTIKNEVADDYQSFIQLQCVNK